MIRNKDIILIGNGLKSIENDSFGQIIDSFDNVVRFNNISLELLESHSSSIGVKTTILVMSGHIFNHMRNEFEIYLTMPNFRKILIPPYRWYARLFEWDDWINQPIHLIHDYNNEEWGKWKIDIVDPSHIVMEHAFWLESQWPWDNKNPTMGLMAILHFIKFYEKIYVIGFDALLSGNIDDFHHYYSYVVQSSKGFTEVKTAADWKADWDFHDWKQEHSIMMDLIKKGKVEVLK